MAGKRFRTQKTWCARFFSPSSRPRLRDLLLPEKHRIVRPSGRDNEASKGPLEDQTNGCRRFVSRPPISFSREDKRRIAHATPLDRLLSANVVSLGCGVEILAWWEGEVHSGQP